MLSTRAGNSLATIHDESHLFSPLSTHALGDRPLTSTVFNSPNTFDFWYHSGKTPQPTWLKRGPLAPTYNLTRSPTDSVSSDNTREESLTWTIDSARVKNHDTCYAQDESCYSSTTFVYSPALLFSQKPTSTLSVVSTRTLVNSFASPCFQKAHRDGLPSQYLQTNLYISGNGASPQERCTPEHLVGHPSSRSTTSGSGSRKRKRQLSIRTPLPSFTSKPAMTTLAEFPVDDGYSARPLSLSLAKRRVVRPTMTSACDFSPFIKAGSTMDLPLCTIAIPHGPMRRPTCVCTDARESLGSLLRRARNHSIDSVYLKGLSSDVVDCIAAPLSQCTLDHETHTPLSWSASVTHKQGAQHTLLSSSRQSSTFGAPPFSDHYDPVAVMHGFNSTVRLGLVNRIIQINDHEDLQYHAETVYLAIHYLDLYFSTVQKQTSRSTTAVPRTTSTLTPNVQPKNFMTYGMDPPDCPDYEQRSHYSSYGSTFEQQLIAVCALYLAAKFSDESYTPLANTFARFLTMYDCTSEDIVSCERHMLQVFQWKLYTVTPHAVAEELLKCLACPCCSPVPVDHRPTVMSGGYPSPCDSTSDSCCCSSDPMTMTSLGSPPPQSLSHLELTLYDEALEFWKLFLLDHTNVGLSPALVALVGLWKASQCVGIYFAIDVALDLTGYTLADLEKGLETFVDDFSSDEE
ncbi:hypothetical protein IWQ61_003046 [Dispira simplex]|nr:hypothetical protein IWQ61_003046 [Dispira simplex]